MGVFSKKNIIIYSMRLEAMVSIYYVARGSCVVSCMRVNFERRFN